MKNEQYVTQVQMNARLFFNILSLSFSGFLTHMHSYLSYKKKILLANCKLDYIQQRKMNGLGSFIYLFILIIWKYRHTVFVVSFIYLKFFLYVYKYQRGV